MYSVFRVEYLVFLSYGGAGYLERESERIPHVGGRPCMHAGIPRSPRLVYVCGM